MSSFWKTAAPVLCFAVICGAAIGWHACRARASDFRLAQDAKVCRARAEHGDARAQADLGYMYAHGRGVPLNYSEALTWYRKAADQGDAMGQDGLAFLYYHGLGVPQDYSEAVIWYRKAADQGDEKGQDGLALTYSQGRGVPQDYTEALRWYRKAADKGYAKAQYDLGYMYYYGKGVPEDRAEAVRWYRRAADQGDEHALRALSASLTVANGFPLLVQLLGSMWLLNLFPFTSAMKGETPRGVRQRIIAGAGILGVFSAGLSLYGYAHYMIRCLSCGLAAFTLSRWLLNAVWIVLLFYTIRSGKGSALRQDGVES
jgi:TPR repeat protein